jgi:HK97 family phage portal protein
VGLLTKTLSALGLKAAEGEYREGPYPLPVTGGWLSSTAGSFMNWWQMGYDVQTGGSSPIVQACVSAYAQTAAMCMGAQWKALEDGGRDRVTNSALSRILRRPNAYQSPSDFILNLTSILYRTGNAYALAVRNSRFEIIELHLMLGACSARVGADGSAFYFLSGNEVIERQIGPMALQGVPTRDVLHVRLETPRHPLLGETPLVAAALDLASSNAMVRQALAFYDRQARPSGVLSTDAVLSPEQTQHLRAAWNEQSRGLNAGGTPILTAGLKWNPITTSARDSQFAEIMKLSDQNIALTFRVPLQILGIGEQKFSTTELMMGSWLASGLGFALNHIEQAFDRLFGLAGAPQEYTEFDTSVLLRSDFKSRVEAWAAGVKGRLFSSDEARADFEFGRKPGGDQIFGQQQDIPLGMLNGSQSAPEPPAPAPAPEPDPNAGRAMVALFQKDLREALGAGH